MFVEASVRNGLDTLKTILKFVLLKYTRERHRSGAAAAAAVQCRVSFPLFS